MLTLILTTAGLIDLRYRKIPLSIVMLLFIYALLSDMTPFAEKVCGFILTALPLFIVALATDRIKGGDLKFLAVLGLAIGIRNLAWLLLFTIIYAGIYTMVTKVKTIPLAFFALLGWITMRMIYILI